MKFIDVHMNLALISLYMKCEINVNKCFDLVYHIVVMDQYSLRAVLSATPVFLRQNTKFLKV